MSGNLDLSLDDLSKAKPKPSREGGRPPREGGRGHGRGISVKPTIGKSRAGRGGGGISVRADVKDASSFVLAAGW